MSKKLFLSISILALGVGLSIGQIFFTTDASALTCSERENCPCDEDDDVLTSGCIPTDEYNNSEVVVPTDYPSQAPADDAAEATENTDESSTDDSESDDNSWFNAERWPVYLSLGVIAITFLLIIIINIAGRRKKR